MSDRGFITVNPGAKAKIAAESAHYIPLAWLSLLSTDDIDNADEDGTIILAREESIKRSAESVSFLSSLYPQVPEFKEAAKSLLKALESKSSKTIGLNVAQLQPDVDEETRALMPSLKAAVEVIEARNVDYSLTIPPQTVENPFTREKTVRPERKIASTAELLMFVCGIHPSILADSEREAVHEAVVGYVWE